MRVQQMNHVNLIGQMSTDPTFLEVEGGKKVARFSLSTKESYLDEQGNTKSLKNWHKVTAWGKWVPVLEQLGAKGQALAIEGRLRSRFYKKNGERKSFTEIEINDLVIL
ncbi:single-stranded DNA-binding protein [Brumimicrobium salinarum]|uniref:Single-stranded DNA-binding protein n=1 Tax=Brumimicrobium salinarum TaxID=2058658 RepID=A0A2I0R6M5_9FLAO|nr:single-stranded DNA-binding protein [Brumimicrobium salinarum]PKR82227.1 single-stranded DNA-binding protein [Brumimicrobium salinarum]